MTQDAISKPELLTQCDQQALELQKLRNEVRELRADNRRLRSYEYDSDMAAAFIASRNLKPDFNAFVLKQQAASRPKLKLVGDE
ncbi:hypothetical protein [Paenibacillus kobensis]|uniref:hypothetical protein n=1 Tax=Paenibacillus kobensis TaxID=59841 RepID=UPI000FDBA7C0|nr:hypothetical protein [Paenibacillus kobensis]